MVDFSGWELPQQYTAIRDEHQAVRKAAGLFDISHMGRLNVVGDGAEGFLQSVVTNDVSKLASGRAQYNLLCQENGGIIDDLVVYRSAPTDFIVVVNASNREKDVEWMRKHLTAGTELTDKTFDVALIALQGPEASKVLPSGSSPTKDIPYFGFTKGEIAGTSAFISRTGYTGEDGFELFIESDKVGSVWDAILESGRSHGVLPAGLGARDILRLEAALRLYGNDMDETVNPYEAGLGWVVKLNKGDFVGRDALEKAREVIDRRQLIGLRMKPGDIPRHGATVTAERGKVGKITSGTHSFFLGYPVALALVEPPSFPIGSTVSVDVRGREAVAEVVELPFYRGSARATAPKHY